ncbi:MAG: hypothetical protein CMK09_11150 [Ponticaulis sp.]|nr:hypothetical protein [Ponticaulis sp.]|tara:strand:- start:65233 stop:66342 length:1110 start_codon:yes stop_codon:yes gene_type:complete
MKSIFAPLSALALLAVSACSSSQPAKNVAQAMPFVMNQDDTIAAQRPALPNTKLIAWTPQDRLYRSVTIDFVEGMSQRSYIFNKPNQQLFRPMLTGALDRAGLLARSHAEARYALQIHFSEIKANSFGTDFAGRSHATYRIVSRLTGEVVYEGDVGANFLVKYPELNERDLAKAYDISEPLLSAAVGLHADAALTEGLLVELINNNEELTQFFDGKIEEASQKDWDYYNRSFFWLEGVSAVLGPLEIIREQLDPSNYFALASDRNKPKSWVYGDRHGYLDEQGFGARDGKERALQASERMLGQSITRFLMDLNAAEGAGFKVILPCTMNDEVREMKIRLMASGFGYRSEPCSPERFDDFEQGWAYTDYQ